MAQEPFCASRKDFAFANRSAQSLRPIRATSGLSTRAGPVGVGSPGESDGGRALAELEEQLVPRPQYSDHALELKLAIGSYDREP